MSRNVTSQLAAGAALLVTAVAGLAANPASATTRSAASATTRSVAAARDLPREQVVERIFLELAGNTEGFSEAEEWHLAEVIHDAAEVEGLDPYLVLAVIRVESTFKRGQRSSAGALGLMQVRTPTGKAFAEAAEVRWRGPRTLLTPEENIRIGTAYLGHLVRRFRGNAVLALTSYCHGPTRVRSLLREGPLPPDRLRYSQKVRGLWRRYRGSQLETPAVG